MKKNLIAGTDEVGRGCLAGPVVAAAVILKNKVDNLNDSKKLSTQKRDLLSKNARKLYKDKFTSDIVYGEFVKFIEQNY